jgi:hypothetical protein
MAIIEDRTIFNISYNNDTGKYWDYRYTDEDTVPLRLNGYSDGYGDVYNTKSISYVYKLNVAELSEEDYSNDLSIFEVKSYNSKILTGHTRI